MEPITVEFTPDESYVFDPAEVNGLDAWEFRSATAGVDLAATVAHLVQMATADAPPPVPFHLLVVAKWLALRQDGAPLLPFAAVAQATTIPWETLGT